MASREEAFDGARGYYDNDVLAARVWTDKYAARDKEGDFKETSPTGTHDRFLTYFPGDDGVGQAVRNGWFVPAGRIQFTMGNRHIRKSTQLNCYVIPIKDDSIEAIFDCAKEMARTYSYGGGCGIDIGCLRFSGATVNNTAITSSGSASFMDMFSNVTGTIGQHGRRGALMITIPVHHPDARLFMRMKDDLDPKLLAKASAELKNYLYEHRTAGHANVSIKLTDEFMRAVEDGKQFRLHWESKDGEISHEEWVDARDYWSEICHQAWKQAEPGLLFWDRMVEESPSNQYEGGEILTTNPCFTGEMRLHTSDGMMTFADLSRLGIDNIVVADNRITATTVNPDCRGTVGRKATPVRLTASQQQIFKLTTNHGHELRCTAYHEFPTPEGRKQLKDLKVGDTLLLQSGEGQWGTMGDYDDGLILGSLTGDGNISRRKKGGPFSVRLSFWNEPDMAARLETIVKDRVVSVSPRSLETAVGIVDVPDRHEQRIGSEVLYRYMHDRYGIDKDSKKRVPECIWQGSREFVRGYLASFFQADGSVQLSGHAKSQTLSVRLAQSNPELLRDVQVLLGNFGIVSSVYLRRKAQKRRLPNGKGGHKAYYCKPQYELIINRPNAIAFEKEVGFAGGKQAQLAEAFAVRGFDCRKPERFVTTVNSVKADGTEDVYCLTELETHSIVVNGVVTAQCGEQPLPPYDSCNLGSVNLRHMVRDAWTGAAEIDWDRFELAIRAGVRFLDKVRTVEKEEDRFPLKEQEAASELFRRIGVGIMGFGEMLASLGFVYGSDESFGFAEKLFEFMRNKAYDESVELARELGPFPAFDWERHRRCPFVRRLPEALQSRIAEHGLRNVTVLSFAPTGTIAILGQTSGGVEPMFAPLYKRYSNLGGKRRMEFNVYDHAILRWQKAVNANFPTDASDVTPETLNLLPPFFVFSHDIPWKARVDLQGMAQKYVDSSISSTINLPADTSEDEVATIYMRAWRAGCKGVTVYRENCRENILETAVQVDEEENVRQPKWVRPMSLRANSLSYKTRNQRVIVNFCDDESDELREVQVIMGRSGDDMHAMCEALGRCISKLLQNGVPVGEIAESLRGIKAGETQWSRFDDSQEAPYVVRSVPDFIAAYIQHRYVRPEVERAATKVSSGTSGASRSGHKGNRQPVPVANEIQRGGDCPMCEGLDEFGR